MNRGKSRKIGLQTEEIVRISLNSLKTEGKIKDYRRIDGQGKDFRITLLDGTLKDFEVKSSHEQKRLHFQRYKTPVLVVWNNKSKWEVTERIEKATMVNATKRKILSLFVEPSD